MISFNSHTSAPRIRTQALCVPLLLSMSTLAMAQPTTRTDSLLLEWLHSSPAYRPQLQMHAEDPILALGSGTLRTDGLGSDADVWGDESDDASWNASSDLLFALAPTVIQSTGAIEADLVAFRELLGNPNNGGTPGELLTGHREVNWDGVPAALTNSIDFPNDFFNNNSPRGLVYDATSRGLEVSDNRFIDINATYAAEFNPFSGTKVFSPRGSNKSDVRFFVAGSNTKAAVRGFGVVFMDVDTLGSTGILLLAADGRSLGRIVAPVRSDARGASFVGIVFREPVISRVRIVTGNGVLAAGEIDISQGGAHDLAVMDDFLYGEPRATGN